MNTEVAERAQNSPIGIAGLGLIGGSLAKSLRQLGRTVCGWDPDPDARARAAADGIVIKAGFRELAQSCPVVFLAVPLAAYHAVAEEISALGLDGDPALFVDVGSARAPFADLVARAGGTSGMRFLGTHPMAGSEHQGYAHARPDLFFGSTWLLLIDDYTRFDDLLSIGRLALDLGAFLLTTDPASHDDAVARVSHLSHVLAGVLSRSAEQGSHPALPLSLAAGSFRDGTRVMTSAPGFAADLCMFNRESLLPVIKQAIADLAECSDALQAEDHARLTRFFASAHAVRQRFLSLASRETPAEESIREGENWKARLLERGRRGERIVGMTQTGSLVHFNFRALADPGKAADGGRWDAETDARPADARVGRGDAGRGAGGAGGVGIIG